MKKRILMAILTGSLLISAIPVYAAPAATDVAAEEVTEESTEAVTEEPTETQEEEPAEEADQVSNNELEGAIEGDEQEIIDAMTTRQSAESPCQVNFIAEVPDKFALSCYAQIMNLATGTIYNIPLYASNDYSQRCYVPAGSYTVTDIGVYEDTTMSYPMTVYSNTRQTDEDPYEFSVADKETVDVRVTLTEYEEVEQMIQDKIDDVNSRKGMPEEEDKENIIAEDERLIEVNTTWEVKHTGDGTGLVGVELDDKDVKQAQECNVIISISSDGVLGMAKFNYTLDGGVTWSDEKEIPLAGKYDVPGMNFHFNFNVDGMDVPGFKSGDKYSCYVPDPTTDIVIEKKGSSNISLSVLATDPEKRAFDILEQSGAKIIFRILKGGEIYYDPDKQADHEYPVYELSLDGGATFSTQQYLKNSELEIPELGLKLVFESNSVNAARIAFEEDDAWRIYATRETKTGLYIGLGIAGSVILFIIFLYIAKMRSLVTPESAYRIDEYDPVKIPVKRGRSKAEQKNKRRASK